MIIGERSDRRTGMYTPLNGRFTLLILLLAVALTTNAQQLPDGGHLLAKEWQLSKVLIGKDNNRIVELLDENHELGLALRGLGLSATAMDSLILQTINAYVRFQVDSVFLTMGHGTERTSFGMTWRQKGRRMKVFVPEVPSMISCIFSNSLSIYSLCPPCLRCYCICTRWAFDLRHLLFSAISAGTPVGTPAFICAPKVPLCDLSTL